MFVTIKSHWSAAAPVLETPLPLVLAWERHFKGARHTSLTSASFCWHQGVQLPAKWSFVTLVLKLSHPESSEACLHLMHLPCDAGLSEHRWRTGWDSFSLWSSSQTNSYRFILFKINWTVKPTVVFFYVLKKDNLNTQSWSWWCLGLGSVLVLVVSWSQFRWSLARSLFYISQSEQPDCQS